LFAASKGGVNLSGSLNSPLPPPEAAATIS
jgi:hypothetical protein